MQAGPAISWLENGTAAGVSAVRGNYYILAVALLLVVVLIPIAITPVRRWSTIRTTSRGSTSSPSWGTIRRWPGSTRWTGGSCPTWRGISSSRRWDG